MKELEIVKKAVRTLDQKKALDVEVIGITQLTIIADYFVLASGSSTTQVKALADEVEFQLKEAGVAPLHIEGRATGWIVLDYGSVVVHVFQNEQREYYQLERLWTDGEKLDVNALLED